MFLSTLQRLTIDCYFISNTDDELSLMNISLCTILRKLCIIEHHCDYGFECFNIDPRDPINIIGIDKCTSLETLIIKSDRIQPINPQVRKLPLLKNITIERFSKSK